MKATSACPCEPAHLARVPRRFWMRLLPWLRHYQCEKCHKYQLANPLTVDNARALAASERAGVRISQ